MFVSPQALADAGPAEKPVPLESVNEPGTYICNWSGNLLRVHETDTQRFTAACHAPPQRWTVTRISTNPGLSLGAARLLATRFGLSTSF